MSEVSRLRKRVALLEYQVRYWRGLAGEDTRTIEDLRREKRNLAMRKSHKTAPQRAESQAYFRAKYANRAPPWADRKKMLSIYTRAAKLTKESGVKYHVDHEIPLRGANVSGLHVETNLRVVLGQENQIKGNRKWQEPRTISGTVNAENRLSD